MAIMNCKKRLKLISSFSDIFSLKMGNIFKCKADNKCYRTSKWFSFFFHIWYGDLGLYFILFLLLFISKVFTILWITFLVSIVLFILLELLIILIMPLHEIECWKQNMEKERQRNIEIGKEKKW